MPLPRITVFHGGLGDSRVAELAACAPSVRSWDWDLRCVRTRGGDEGPSRVQRLPDGPEDSVLADAAARAVGCRGAFELWGEGETLEACGAATRRVPVDHVRARVPGPWRVVSVVLGALRSPLEADLGARMDAFGHVLDPLADRPVRLQGPATELWLVEDRRVLEAGGPLPGRPPRFRLLLRLPSDVPDTRDTMKALDLRRRAFLGTSTLPPDRALLLSNLALRDAGPGATLLDPFCGSGGVLLAAASLGARVTGSDLDWRMVSDNRVPIQIPATRDRPERGVEAVRMRDNFDEAGLPGPQALLVLDVGAPDAVSRLLTVNGGRSYDAVVTDPPYGRREFQGGEDAWDGALTFRVDAGSLAVTLTRLMDLCTGLLRPGGRLVFLAPVRSPRDPSKPTLTELRTWLQAQGEDRGMVLWHLAEERVHRGLHRAVVGMERR